MQLFSPHRHSSYHGLLNIMLTWQIRVAYYYNTKTFCIEFQKLRDEKLKSL